MNIEQNEVFNSNLLLNSICESLDFELSNSEKILEEITLKNNSGHGKISFKTFSNNMSIINFDINLEDDLTVKIPNLKTNLYFFYVLEGTCYHSFDNSEKFFKIDELRTVALASSKNDFNQLTIKKNTDFKCNIIAINQNDYFQNFTHQKDQGDHQSNLKLIFETLQTQVLQTAFNLKINRELRVVKEIMSSRPMTSQLLLQSSYQIILSHHVEQLYNDTYNQREYDTISQSEVKKINDITDYITDNPGLKHSQEIICSQFFISQSKLQIGFKAVHKTTVSNFTRDVRLKKAEDLLLNSELNVSEIVYTVGFTSRSYFSKIFKLKFGCNPTTYRLQHQAKKAIAA